MCAAGAAQELPAQVLHAVFQEVLPGQAGEALRNLPHTHSVRQQTAGIEPLPSHRISILSVVRLLSFRSG